MAHLTDYKLQRVLTRFPWRRRKPGDAPDGAVPVGITTNEGQQLWADLGDLAHFEDAGPAMVYVAMRSDETAQKLVRMVIEHHAHEQDRTLPGTVPELTTAGMEVLDGLLERCGLDPSEPVGPHGLRDLLAATWAIAAADTTTAAADDDQAE